MGRVPSVGVFLRDPNPYLCEMEHKDNLIKRKQIIYLKVSAFKSNSVHTETHRTKYKIPTEIEKNRLMVEK